MFHPEFTADKIILDDLDLAEYTENGEDPTIIQLKTWRRDSNNIARKINWHRSIMKGCD
jgi:hypothetical protein